MKYVMKTLICAWLLLITTQSSHAQYSANLSDKDCVGFSIDLIRKGIQQEDTAIVMRVLGANISIQGEKAKAKTLVAQNLDQIFVNSSKRIMVEGDRALPKPRNRRNDSNLWDFDILSPQITIDGDSAIVECELVLWQTDLVDRTKTGSKVTERLVFWSPFKGQPEKTASNSPFRWKLIKCDNLFDFLSNYGVMSEAINKKNRVLK